MIVRIKGTKWTLPDIVQFGSYAHIGDHYTYDVVDFRPPLKGEFYLSGAEPQAYQAANNLSTPFLVVTKKTKMVQRLTWVPFEQTKEIVS